ncbi:diguanylate cyclase domain-containing protein [Marinobacterium arenosum]|uniref:diguanylate cyclase domain-containing protein n=1 Tax=Marinobacterium arenosum TaxID=2862496 RepID=UPI001C984928|nr:diguanylate cyclase [Marinobacterium arenosum]MBY4677041.1 diguanylate cyclase [Marinobacterium arenosum]
MSKRQTILLVDDETRHLKVLVKAFLNDYRVLFARSGDEALQLVQQEAPDLIILDVMMPGMDGYQLFGLLQQDQALRQVPVIFLTGRDGEADERRGLEMGAVDYWTKPVSIDIARIRARNHLELKRHRDLLAKLAITDSLCDIANRRGFEDYLAREWHRAARTGRPVSLLMIDIDYFKAFNDHYGHPAGDQCLRQVAALIDKTLSRPADLAARYGGEEFVCVLPETPEAGARVLAQKLRQAVADSGMVHGHSPLGNRLTISLGAATLQPDEAGDPAELVELADQALYDAKNGGRDRVVVAGMVLTTLAKAESG